METQAYTVELEAELNKLKEENTRLQEEQKTLLDKRKRMLLECMAETAQTSGERKAKILRRLNTCTW